MPAPGIRAARRLTKATTVDTLVRLKLQGLKRTADSKITVLVHNRVVIDDLEGITAKHANLLNVFSQVTGTTHTSAEVQEYEVSTAPHLWQIHEHFTTR